MKLELNKIYFYQGLGGPKNGQTRCIFLRPIKRSKQYTLIVTCFNLLDALRLPILEDGIDYGKYQEKGYVTNIWNVKEEEFLKNSILIPHDELPEERIGRINSSMIYPKAIDKVRYERELILNNILENEKEE